MRRILNRLTQLEDDADQGQLPGLPIATGYARGRPSAKRPIIVMVLPKCPGVGRTANAPHGGESVRLASNSEIAGSRR
jgi:hypothetical protein